MSPLAVLYQIELPSRLSYGIIDTKAIRQTAQANPGLRFTALYCSKFYPLASTPSRRGEIVLSPVVGYQNIAVKPGFNMIALNFQPIDGTEEIAI